MSRTFRKRKGRSCFTNDLEHAMSETVYQDELDKINHEDLVDIRIRYYSVYSDSYQFTVRYTAKSREGKKRAAYYHSDAYTHECKEPGPSAWKNLTTHRPYRRKYKEQCRKALYDADFEVVIEKIVYPYWT